MLTYSKDVLVSNADQFLDGFIRNAIKHFFDELDLYINHNQDFDILSYANEQTLSSLLVNGIIRNNGNKGSITAVQEYGTYFRDSISHGRPDIFIRKETTGVWIESKYSKATYITADHWDIGKWLDWDKNTILNQVEGYYNAEKDEVNDTYSDHYIMSLAFKLVNTDPASFFEMVDGQLYPYILNTTDRTWYYSVGFVDKPDKFGNSLGVEVYGTARKVK